VFEALFKGEGESADAIIEAKGLKQITDSGEIEGFVDQVIADNPDQVEQYREGKTKVIGFLVGQVMKASKGKANPKEVNQMLAAKLAE
jgi:aspartyl-tRNA(Asn)/glutamyl-tRNA(Gln) amidotransferase subunit B